jgi:hypothetical protein
VIDATPAPDLLPPPDLSTCAATSATAEHFVDSSLGVDDPLHGGGVGACAYKSITYALTRAQGQITLVSGQSYSEPLPLVLTGAQSIAGDPAGSARAIVVAPAGATGAILTIGANAATSAITGLIVDGGGNYIDCIDVLSAGPSTIDGVELRGCTFAVRIRPGGDNVTVIHSSIHDVGWGVYVDGGTVNHVRENSISANPYAVLCTPPTSTTVPDAAGCGNTFVMGSCSGCGACAALTAACQ